MPVLYEKAVTGGQTTGADLHDRVGGGGAYNSLTLTSSSAWAGKAGAPVRPVRPTKPIARCIQ